MNMYQTKSKQKKYEKKKCTQNDIVKNQIISALEKVKQTTNSYNQKVLNAKGVVKTIEGELELKKEDYENQIYEIKYGGSCGT